MNRIDELRKQMLRKAKEDTSVRLSAKDIHVIKAVNVLEDLDSVFNLLAEQIIEWYGSYFPELWREVDNNEKYLRLVYNLGSRDNYSADKVKEYLGDDERASAIEKLAKESFGGKLNETAMKEVQLLALNALNIKEEREFLMNFLEKEMTMMMPNFSRIATTVVAAKIIAKLGSSERVAFVPASTLQVIGAEKALFRHLKKKARPPKHGYIFQHPLVKAAPKQKRGKIARALAGKMAIAAKQDYFGSKEGVEALEKQLNTRVNQINAGKDKNDKMDQTRGKRY
ncbi:MAG: Protein implicated in ribosomal biogenesis, Nop56p-like protein [Parcubacteria group bacterium GW2011_GWA2_48_9]|nr:MAG: Protein implicated in ribosomal biogenesis, Nop56p-like protein [Parcubacteria group bacterium GW2011_GWA2_48_9]